MIIAIDGPSASGKSTLARELANKLEIYYVSTGLLYRAIGYELMHSYHYTLDQLKNPKVGDVRDCISHLEYEYVPHNHAFIYFKGENITEHLKTKEADIFSSTVAANESVRDELLPFQRNLAKSHDVVMEGRDIGSVIFPNADFKFYITASEQVRAHRWQQYQDMRGEAYLFDECLKTIHERDLHDMQRKVSPLRIPEGAVVVDTTSLNKEETLQKILEIMASKERSS